MSQNHFFQFKIPIIYLLYCGISQAADSSTPGVSITQTADSITVTFSHRVITKISSTGPGNILSITPNQISAVTSGSSGSSSTSTSALGVLNNVQTIQISLAPVGSSPGASASSGIDNVAFQFPALPNFSTFSGSNGASASTFFGKNCPSGFPCFQSIAIAK